MKGFSGAFCPDRAAGRPSGQTKDARVQYSRVLLAVQPALTGLVKVTVTRSACSVPAAQLGVQSSIFSVPVPTAWVAVHVGQVMSHKNAVLSPDSAQPDLQAGLYATVPFTSPLSAKYTFAPDWDAPEPEAAGVADGGAAETETGPMDTETNRDGDGELCAGEAVVAVPPADEPVDEDVLAQPASKAIAATGSDNIRARIEGIWSPT